MFGHARPDDAMVEAVRRARAQGVRTGLISNSMGVGRYDRSTFPELFDGVVISGEVGMHKPQPEIFRLGAERIGVPPEECVFVDDLRENCEGGRGRRDDRGAPPRRRDHPAAARGAAGNSA